MRREDLIAFARRDWASLAAMKERYWAELKPQMTPAEALRVSGELRAAVMGWRSDWPSEEERRLDLEMHARVSENLQSVVSTRTR
jgi:hypothetical protein